MTQATGNNHPRVVSTINKAIGLAKNDQLTVAIEALRALAAEFPLASSVHGYLAWFLLEIGGLEEALQHSQEAVRLSPASETASLVHFHVMWKAGLHIQAISEMNRFLAVRPSEEYANIIRGWNPDMTMHEETQ